MQRQIALKNWLSTIYKNKTFELEFAAADADFRRYFRVRFANNSTLIAMDAPPDKMDTAPYVRVRELFTAVNVPQIINHDKQQGFMLLEDLGKITFLSALQEDSNLEQHKYLLLEAIDCLVELQKSSQANLLPEYDAALLKRELDLFPEWFCERDQKKTLTLAQKQLWDNGVAALLPAIVEQPKVFVHRDFIVRNLMLTPKKPGVLDFQDAVYGPISYDLVSLLRDAFISWEEDFVLDLVIRYWEKARAAGLPISADIDKFWRDFEWMGVQRHLKVIGIFCRLRHRDGKDKYYAEIPRFLNYLKNTTRRYRELAPFYRLLLELVGDEQVVRGYTF